ncbi:phage tail family protein [Lactococcus formosensis]|uniref:phage tail domain-containing protein n=1 Tax=Lactococcus formosensis TaxID=1281486 RepID=UPI0020980F72|nr:phage tail family protein [Lactococcus formosensis]
MNDFFNFDEPNFIFNGVNALVDMGCIIEKELPDIQAKPRIDEITVIGRSGTLSEWHGDYETYNLDVGKVSIPYENLEDVKRWLTGYGKLITHNDRDKYMTAIPSFSTEVKFENEWGMFYTFNLTFHCQPFKRKVNEQFILLKGGVSVFNSGSVVSYPLLKVDMNSSDLTILCNNAELKVNNLTKGLVEIDCEKGMVLQNGKFVPSIGEWFDLVPGENKISITGNYSSATLLMRSLWV